MEKSNTQLTVELKGQPDIHLITQHMLFPLNTRYTQGEGLVFRYIVDENGYRWIGCGLRYLRI